MRRLVIIGVACVLLSCHRKGLPYLRLPKKAIVVELKRDTSMKVIPGVIY